MQRRRADTDRFGPFGDSDRFSYSRDSAEFDLKVNNDARYPEHVSHVIVLTSCITISRLVRIYQSVRNSLYSFFTPLSQS